MMERSRRASFAVVVAVALTSAVVPVVRADPALVAEVVRLTNAERAKQGLPALKPNAILNKAALAHSENMAAQKRLEHSLDGKGPGDRMTAHGYNWGFYAENIFAGPTSAAQAVQGWMNSPGHRKNILGDAVTEIGVGIAKSSDGTLYWTQKFGLPLDRGDAPAPAPEEAKEIKEKLQDEKLQEKSDDVVAKLNAARTKQRAGKLRTSPFLEAAADKHAKAMAAAGDLIDLENFQYPGAWAAQYGSGSGQAGDIAEQWTKQAEAAALKGDYNEIGVGVAVDAKGNQYYCYIVGRNSKPAPDPAPDTPKPDPNPEPKADPDLAEKKSIDVENAKELTLEVTNGTRVPIKIQWVDGEGNESSSDNAIPAGEKVEVGSTYPGHFFRARHAETNALIQEFRVRSTGATFSITIRDRS